MIDKKESILILPDIRSAINVGAIFRTADAVGIDQIYLTGWTPRPIDKFGRIQKDIAKSALGAETWIPWGYKKTLIPLITILKKETRQLKKGEVSFYNTGFNILRDYLFLKETHKFKF